MRIESARRVVGEKSRREIACQPVVLCAVGPNTSRSKRFEFLERLLHGPRMGFENPIVFVDERRDGHRLRRREREIVEDPPIGRILAVFSPRGIQPLGQRPACGRILILAQPQEVIGADLAGQPEPFRPQPDPFATDTLSLIVVVADTEMFLEVLAGVLEVVLRLGCDHIVDNMLADAFRGVSHTCFMSLSGSVAGE